MGRFWNLQTKFVAVIVLLLLGSFVAQSFVHHANEDRLLSAVMEISEALANEVTERIEAREVQQPLTEIQPMQASAFPAPPRDPGRWLRIRTSGGTLKLVFREPSPEERRRYAHMKQMWRNQCEQLVRELRPGNRQLDLDWRASQAEEHFLRILRDLNFASLPLDENDFEDPASEERERALAIEPTWVRSGGPPETRAELSGNDRLDSVAPAAVAPGGAAAGGAALLAVEDAAPMRVNQAKAALPSGASEPVAVPGSSAFGGETAHAAPNTSEPTSDGGDAIDIAPYAQRFRDIFAEYRRYDIMATVGIFLMGIACAWWLGLRITEPVYQVVDGFRRVSNGDLGVVVPEKGSGEFALLGQQFNCMVERLRENRLMERELEQRERVQLMGDLAAGVAHDVRNPLNAIHLNVGQIRDEFVPQDEPSRERFLRFTSDVQREVVRLNRLVTDFLSLARPAGEEIAPVDPNELLRDLSRLISKEAAGRKIEVREQLDPEIGVLSWNAQQITSAFLNVTLNALQAMEPDGGVLTLQSEMRSGGGNEREAVISIIDTGCGIPAELCDKVFLPYFTTRKGGTGLGMAIARRVTERNGGQIALLSEVGKGTTVEFHFPVRQPEGART